MANGVKIMQYADDTTFLYKAGKVKEDKILKIVDEWFTLNLLSLNSEKTKKNIYMQNRGT